MAGERADRMGRGVLQARILFSRDIKMKKVHYDSFEFNYRSFKRVTTPVFILHKNVDFGIFRDP